MDVSGEKPRKDKVKASPEALSQVGSKSRETLPNTPGGYSDKVRQTTQDGK